MTEHESDQPTTEAPGHAPTTDEVVQQPAEGVRSTREPGGPTGEREADLDADDAGARGTRPTEGLDPHE